MMRCWLIRAGGQKVELPDPIRWQMEYTDGVPCDSFSMTCLWEPGRAEELTDAVFFTAVRGGETVFHGVVDEISCGWDEKGSSLELSGRGMAALLLDNEALSCQYQVATLADILRDHVRPYGIETAETAPLPAVPGFSVPAGSSEWQVLVRFAQYYGGIQPRFDPRGRLILSRHSPEGPRRILDTACAVTALRWRFRRYGMLSEVLVRDRTGGSVQKLQNQEFVRRGGRCRRVLTMPGRSSYQARRYSGNYQLEQSARDHSLLEVELPGLFCAWPGEPVELRLPRLPHQGRWRTVSLRTGVDRRGEYSRLILREE